MTMSVTIVNSSNWLNEPVNVEVKDEGGRVLLDETVETGNLEGVSFPANGSDLLIRVSKANPSENAAPKRNDMGEQVMPKVQVVWE